MRTRRFKRVASRQVRGELPDVGLMNGLGRFSDTAAASRPTCLCGGLHLAAKKATEESLILCHLVWRSNKYKYKNKYGSSQAIITGSREKCRLLVCPMSWREASLGCSRSIVCLVVVVVVVGPFYRRSSISSGGARRPRRKRKRQLDETLLMVAKCCCSSISSGASPFKNKTIHVRFTSEMANFLSAL